MKDKKKEKQEEFGFRMERKGTNCKITSGGKTIKMEVPSDRSVLSIFGLNPGYDGGVYAGDGWIYIDGKKIRKWFIHIEGIRVWEPKLLDLRKLEKSYWLAFQRMNKFHEKVFKPAYDAIKEVGKAHAYPTHKYEPWNNCTWWLYKCRKYGENDYGVSFDWVEAPEKPLNPEIGQRYYKTERQWSTICAHSYMFATVLERAITQYLDKEVDKKEGRMVDLVLNERHYLYVCVQEQYYFYFRKIAWPKDDYQTLILE